MTLPNTRAAGLRQAAEHYAQLARELQVEIDKEKFLVESAKLEGMQEAYASVAEALNRMAQEAEANE